MFIVLYVQEYTTHKTQVNSISDKLSWLVWYLGCVG